MFGDAPFYANTVRAPQAGDVYTKNGKTYAVTKDLDLIGVRTGKVWGNANDEAGQPPASPRILVVRDGATS